MTGRLVEVVRAVNRDVSVSELADAVWLLGVVYPPDRHQRDPAAPAVDPAQQEVASDPPTVPSVPPPAQPPPPGQIADMHLPRHDRLLEVPARVPVRSPGATALPGTLAMARALRPLRRRLRSRTSTVLDEEATVQQAVDGDLWVPAFRPALDRWLDLAMVVDDSASMVIWHRTCAELRDLLERLGAFRDVRVWRCDTDLRGRDGQLTLQPAAMLSDAAGRDVRELVDPARRRLVLVVSDCVGRAWQTGEMSRALRAWGAAGSVAIVQTLPQRLWEACAPRFIPVRLGVRKPGAPNTEMHVQVNETDTGEARQMPVPVLELAPRWFVPWARLVSATGPEWISSTAMFAGDAVSQPPVSADRPPEREADELLAHFESFASTEALRLAACLASAPLSLPVIRLVQQTMLPGSRPSVLAEVFLGGLLRQRRPSPDRELDPDEVTYDFAPGVRARLLATLTRQDKVSVLARVSDYVAGRLGSPLDFRALLTAAEDAADVLEQDPPFAEVALQVLRDLGGRYREAAILLQHRTRTLATPRPSTAATEDPADTISGESVKSGEMSGNDQRRDSATMTEETQPGDTVVTAPSTEAAPERPAEVARQPTIFGGVPYRNPHFTGRDELLEQLHSALREGTSHMALLPHALHGMGGVGKTQLAVEYAYRYAAEYDLVWWVPAESPTTVRSSLAQLAAEMKLAAGDVSRAVANVLGALRTGEPYLRWLMVLDNADQPDDFKELLPLPVGHVLVTSRNPQWADVAAQLEVNVFNREESVALLQRRGRGISASDADELAARLGDLPLAIDQAAAWQSETGMPARDLARMLDERIHVLLNENPPTTYPVTVMATWELAFARLQEQSPGAAELLQLCAFLGSEPISVSLLWDGRHADLSGPVAQVLRDDIMLRRAIRDIQRYALAKVDPSRDQVVMHRLVQAVLREQLTPERQEATRDTVHEILGAANPGDPENPNTWTRHAELLPHVTPSGVINAKTNLARRVLLDQTYYRFIRGDYERSRILGERAVSRWRETLGADHELTLLAQRHLAMAMGELGDRAEAAALNQQTLARMREVFGADHEHTLTTATNVGLDLRRRGEFRAARELDEDNLARHRRIFGEEHLETIRMMNNVAVNLRLLGDSAGALAMDITTLRAHERILGTNHRGTLISLTNVARDHFDVGRYREAEELLAEALPRMRTRMGERDLVTLMAKRVWVMVRRRQGAYGAARELAEELYGDVRRIYRADHERVLSAQATYANALLGVGELAHARSLAEQALHGYRGTFGERHPFTVAAAVNLAMIMRAGEEYPAARQLDESALAEFRQLLGDDHPHTLVAMLNLATDWAIAYDHQRALELSKEAYTRSRSARGDDHPATLICGLNYSLDLRATGDRPAAQSLFEEVLAGLRRVLGDGHPAYREAADGRRADRDIEVWAV
jgi:tetratricopeptide (TPR) repeat protein